jgi:hypothetical protein
MVVGKEREGTRKILTRLLGKYKVGKSERLTAPQGREGMGIDLETTTMRPSTLILIHRHRTRGVQPCSTRARHMGWKGKGRVGQGTGGRNKHIRIGMASCHRAERGTEKQPGGVKTQCWVTGVADVSCMSQPQGREGMGQPRKPEGGVRV